MSVEWFNFNAGDDVGQSSDDPAMLIIGIGKPDWVPADTGHGGRYRCLELVTAACPNCRTHDCTHYILDGPVSVAECKATGQFWWYSRSKP